MPKFPLPIRLFIDTLAMLLLVVVDYGTIFLLYMTPLGDILRGYSILVGSVAGLLAGLAYAFYVRDRLLFYPDDAFIEETPLEEEHRLAQSRLTVPLSRTNVPKLTVPLYKQK